MSGGAVPMTQMALQAGAVSKRFGNVLALDDVAFDLERGEVHCLVGENGCGKSTLIKAITGVYVPAPGASFQFGDEAPVARMTPAEAKARGIHVIWQDLSLFPDLTVGENIIFDAFVEKPFALSERKAALRRARTTMEDLGVSLDLDAPLRQLGIAQRQLVAICRVLQTEASIIFMDEPTASLTRTETENLLGIVRKLSARGISIVFVSHRLGEVLEVCSRVTVMRDGRIVGTFPAEGMDQKRLAELMTGHELQEGRRDWTNPGAPVLQLDGLTVSGQFSDVSFTLHRGEILGLTGLLGSGRTELAHAIFGMTRPDRGRILIDGAPVALRSNRDAIAAGIAYVSEDRLNLGLHQTQSILKNTAITTLKELSSPSFYLGPGSIRALCAEWIGRLRTKVSDPSLPVNSLSGGNQQRVVLAKWLATRPKVLILDSPTVGVDVGAKAEIFRIVDELTAEGMAIILISDEAAEIHAHSDRILILRNGRITRDLLPGDISEDDLEALINA
ncbi:sugar ABC transporter ATP-binding protein [Rhodobium gokarnense]|uniref:Simple sugar transport system ATP-binding protein n=1 Tax=Rhodobium gokarnense TaxID=364296 RepID=A0ABT3HAD1_9HYPH|nr:sugar ABC transporter ATP-binding protein [Rhodobium gokarnense]MCW2307356.1 simple sugar transport system ATP-binding protein [Rhodobium gokarnense]